MTDSEDRSADASPRRVQVAREAGMVPLAPALVRCSTLIACIALLYMRGPVLAKSVVTMIRRTWSDLPSLARQGMTGPALQERVLEDVSLVAEPLLMVCLGALAAALVVHQATTGGSWTPSLALPKPERLLAFWAKFDDESPSHKPPLLHRVSLGVLRPLAAVVGCVVVMAVLRWRWSTMIPDQGTWTHENLLEQISRGRSSIGLGLVILTVPLFCLGLMEMFLARIHWQDRLRPTTDQARQETRDLEGDPELKRRRLRLVRTIRETETIESLLKETALVVVGSGMSGLCVQLVRMKSGRLAVGQTVRGTISARYAEKAAAQGLPWLRDARLALKLALMTDVKHRQPVELPLVIAQDIQQRTSGRTRTS